MVAAPNIRILIIDDNALIRTATKMVLSTCRRFSVIGEASDGNSGIRLAKDLKPDVVLTDINMEPLDGIQTTHRLLTINSTLLVIGFSALPHKHQEREMLDAGAAAVIHKSASRREICDTIIQLVEGRSAYQDQYMK